ncbi:ArsR/SmtB family transcription factor [Nocardia sp. NPDC059180]|uniref:ArsR/SmtB family transcription factor n=1 Tax=Nocardia sp. NPDC059180 TaxID=3346761 RepID=UPI0036CEF759
MAGYENAWTALGDPRRRQIFECLTERPRSVTEIADGLPISRPAVSQHLRVLADARLVRARQEGTRRIYEVDPGGLAALRKELEGLWTKALENVKQVAEEE